MCEDCGCNRSESFHLHTGAADHFHAHRDARGRVQVHAHSHEGHHRHGDAHAPEERPGETRDIEVNRSLLEVNDRLAERNRGYFRAKNVTVLNLVSSPGAGKTALLERTLEAMSGRARMAVIVGDLATENDAERLRGRAAEVVQVSTGTLCHLDAGMVSAAAESLDLDGIDLLFIENVGNLVCPASFDLGETRRVVLLSVPEGEDKPFKYPPIFKSADLVLLTKTDLAEASGFDRDAVLSAVSRVAPQAGLLEISSRTGSGLEAWFDYLAGLTAASKGEEVCARV